MAAVSFPTVAGQRGVALQVELRALQLGLILGALGDCLVERRLVGRGVDLGDDVALAHLLPLMGGKGHEHAIDLGPDLDGVEGLHSADAVEIDRHVLGLGLRHRDGHGGRRRRLRRRVRRLRPAQHAPAAPDHDHADHKADDPEATPLHLVHAPVTPNAA